MKMAWILASACLVLVATATPFLTKTSSIETATATRYEQLVPDEGQVVRPAEPNTNLRTYVRPESVGESIAGWVILIVGLGAFAGIGLAVYHSIRRVDRGEGGIHRPGVPYVRKDVGKLY